MFICGEFFSNFLIRIVTAMFHAIQSSISELFFCFFFRLISSLFYKNIAIITFSFAVTGVNLLLDINYGYLDMIMFILKIFVWKVLVSC